MGLLKFFSGIGFAAAALFTAAAVVLLLLGVTPGGLTAVGMALAWLVFALLVDNCRLRALLKNR